MTSDDPKTLHIAIIGAGFSGTAMAAALHRYTPQPLSIYLFEKTGQFAAGDAYRTPFAYHLLNARAGDMSAFEDDANHFVSWLQTHVTAKLSDDVPLNRQFVPRVLYYEYLQSLLHEIDGHCDAKVTLNRIPDEVMNIETCGDQVRIITRHQPPVLVDKVVLATGNNPPAKMPFAMSSEMRCIENPWDYTSLNQIPADDPVLIIGTGLSMVDAVLTLHHQQHRGKITAVSRRGLLPLPHSETCAPVHLNFDAWPRDVRGLMRVLRKEAAALTAQGGDWRGLMSAMRLQLQTIWQEMNEINRKRFLRHVLPYWNIHRHRVHVKLHDLMMEMQAKGQLNVLAGRVLSAKQEAVEVRLRQSRQIESIPVKHIINCMGSSFEPSEQPLMQSLLSNGLVRLDALRLGMSAAEDCALISSSGSVSTNCYVLGPPMRGEVWECIAVPEIRKQCKTLAHTLLGCQP